MKTILIAFTQILRIRAGALALGILVAAQLPAMAGSTAFSRIFVFGDSLSDTGNFSRLTGGFPPPPYADGRFSNGRLWVEYLADDLGMEILPEDNYAVAGATTGELNSNNGLFGHQYPGLQNQLESFLATHQNGADPNALYLLWVGANDFFVALDTGMSPTALIGGGVANTAQAIQVLWAAGAKHIVVANIPDLGLTPFALGTGMSSAITQLSAAYNQTLAAALDALAQAGVDVIRVDAFTTLRRMAYSPADFGFTNVTQPLISAVGEQTEFLFWDAVHPTTRGHEVLEGEALRSIVNFFSPAKSQTVPDARANSLHGLLRAKGN